MNEQTVFHVAKATAWRNSLAALLVVILLLVGLYYLLREGNPTPQSVKTVVTTPVVPASVVVTQLPPAPVAPIVTECNCKCECCADKKVSKPPKKVKKPIRKPVAKAAPAMPPAPRYVPPVYSRPTIKNPETGKMVPAMPLGIQPKFTCVEQKGGVPCAK